ncbi:cysteinyl leukotriene receptor 2-like [Gigantopelta aegis]|uniref:cysteinyl leukotriene receptor 2-like n=1 Tax=Gigantopelta aegis TaxID=1735272 RepID=UPI001B88B0F5|nr:cysteinyl leukotriene receptor 2-like [Gigantopelta aegis]
MADFNNSADNMHPSDPNSIVEFVIATWLWRICGAVIIFPGLTGNIIAIYIFSKLDIASSTANVHFFVLTITDSAILVTVLLRQWIVFTFDYDLRNISNLGCKIHHFLAYTLSDFSPWVLVSLSCERVISVYFPFDFRRWCTVRRAVCKLAAMFFVFCIINAHLLWTYGLIPDGNDMSCELVNEGMIYYDIHVFVWLDLLFVSFIPFVIMLVCSMLIIRKLSRSDFAYNPRTGAVSTTDPDTTSRGRPKMDRNTSDTRLLLVFAILYVCLSLPHSSTYIIFSYITADCYQSIARIGLAWTVTYLVQACNYSINIVLYTARSKKFRVEFRKLFRRTSPRFVGRENSFISILLLLSSAPFIERNSALRLP